MKIQIDEKTRIVGGKRCWHVERPRKRKGEVSWVPFLYYRSIGHALTALGEREIRLADTHTLPEAIRAVHQVAAKYSKLFDDALAEIERGVTHD